MSENSAERNEALQRRLRDFALRIIKLYSSLPKSTEAQVIGRQFLRSGTSPGAQFREARRAKSDPDFISKAEGALQELDETDYWLDLLGASGIVDPEYLSKLIQEINELISILVTIVVNTKKRKTSASSEAKS